MQTGLTTINDKPAAVYSLQTLQRHPLIEGIVLVRNKNDAEVFDHFISHFDITKVVAAVDSGKVRRQSMYNGLLKVPKCGVVVFHQVTNPFITSAEITAVIDAARETGAAAVGRPVKDTIKIAVASDHSVIKTIHRSEPHIRSDIEAFCLPNRKVEVELYQTEVPQAIQYQLAIDSYKAAMDVMARFTDDVQLVENNPKANVTIVPASPWNIRIASDADVIALNAFRQHWDVEECHWLAAQRDSA